MRLFSKKIASELANREPVEMEVADWDAQVLIGYLDGEQRIKYFSTLTEGANGNATELMLKQMYKVVMMTLLDDDGQLMFDVDSEDDLELVAKMPLTGVRKVAERAAEINGLLAEADAEK